MVLTGRDHNLWADTVMIQDLHGRVALLLRYCDAPHGLNMRGCALSRDAGGLCLRPQNVS